MIRLATLIGTAVIGALAVVMPALADNTQLDGTAIDIPEPASLALLAVAAGTLVLIRRQR